jgi:hypothetical protein
VVVSAASLYWLNPFTPSRQDSSHPLSQAVRDKSLHAVKIEKHTDTPIRSRPEKQVIPPSPPTNHPPTLDQKLADLLIKAQKQLTKYHLSLPPGDNCSETYQQILALDPSNQAAQSTAILGEIFNPVNKRFYKDLEI